MDSNAKLEQRSSLRKNSSFKTIVKGQDVNDIFWKETSTVTTISRTGASFNLERECPVGKLISLIMPMPLKFRCYDSDTELYRVWGLIQHCNPISTDDFTGYQIGVAFIGKYAPESFKSNPSQSYRILGVGENGLWKIIEAKKDFVKRKNPRFAIALAVDLSILDDEGNIISTEATTTENISLCGAAVFSTLKVETGCQIVINSTKHNFKATAIVCDQQKREKETSILHLNFIDYLFPMRETFLQIENVEPV